MHIYLDLNFFCLTKVIEIYPTGAVKLQRFAIQMKSTTSVPREHVEHHDFILSPLQWRYFKQNAKKVFHKNPEKHAKIRGVQPFEVNPYGNYRVAAELRKLGKKAAKDFMYGQIASHKVISMAAAQKYYTEWSSEWK
jgi:hypothetical protein